MNATSLSTPFRKPRRTYKPTPDPRNPPPRITRPMVSELAFALFGVVVSPRTVETWPLETRLVNGRATLDTAEAMAHARTLLDGSPNVRGGRTRKANA